MRKDWFEDHPVVLGILLLVLAVINGGLAIFSEHPIMALANGAMAVVLALGVILFWRAGRAN